MRKQIIVMGLLVLPALSAAQQQPGRPLSLQEAIRLAADASEQVTIARAGIRRATGEQYRARSEYLPQLGGSLSYTRTLQTEFSALSEGNDTTSAPRACSDFNPNRLLPISERVDSLESALRCRDDESPFGDLFSNLPFGRANQWNLGLAASQLVYSGGRVQAQNRIAAAGKRTAEINLATANAQLILDVTQAYYDATLNDQLYAISELTMKQAETTLHQVKVARQVGDQPEFELLRAQVTHDNQRPVVIQRRSDRDIAHMRLKQLLNLPVEESLVLTTQLQSEALPVIAVSAAQTDTAADMRAPVREAMEMVRVEQALEAIARSQRLPNVSISSQYGRVAYPNGAFPVWNGFRSNWTVSAALQIPIFTGGRIRGDAMVAEANVMEARARLQQTRELAALDTRSAVERMRAAEAAWQASAGTVEQAAKAYSIAEIRFREGISTQVELNDARILLQQAQANRAIAARDVQVSRARVTLLPDLPIGAGGGGSGVGVGFGNVGVPIVVPTAPVQPNAAQNRRAGN